MIKIKPYFLPARNKRKVEDAKEKKINKYSI